jgi:hypothetical protein
VLCFRVKVHLWDHAKNAGAETAVNVSAARDGRHVLERDSSPRSLARAVSFCSAWFRGSIVKRADRFPLFLSFDMVFPPFGARASLGERVRSLFRPMLRVTESGALCWPRRDGAKDARASRLSEAGIERTQAKPKSDDRQSQAPALSAFQRPFATGTVLGSINPSARAGPFCHRTELALGGWFQRMTEGMRGTAR